MTTNFVDLVKHAHQLVERLREMQAKVLHLESAEARALELEHTLQKRDQEIQQLQATCQSLRDELEGLTKVSQIIAFQKENALLKSRIEILERVQRSHAVIPAVPAIQTVPVAPPTVPAIAPPAPPPPKPTTYKPSVPPPEREDPEPEPDEPAEPESEPEPEIEYVIKTIKGNKYWMDPDTGLLYQYEVSEDEDGNECASVGDRCGRLETTPAGKTKVYWISLAGKE